MLISIQMVDICQYCKQRSKATESLEFKELEKLGHSCNEITFKKGQRIIIQGAVAYNIAYLKEGLAKIHQKGPEKEQILKVTKAPSYLGLPTTLASRINQYTVTAIADSKVCFISNEIFQEFIINNGKFSYEIIVTLCKQELEYYRRSINQIQKQSSGKIADALLFFANDIYLNNNFTIPLTRNDMGDLTCTSRETVSRVLSDFAHNHLIEIDKNDIKIIDKEQLEMISKHG